jgi:hypothetical protein
MFYIHKFKVFVIMQGLILVAARCEVWVCGRLIAGIAGSNPIDGMDVLLTCL